MTSRLREYFTTGTTMINGTAYGVDSYCLEWARAVQHPVVEMPAEWDKYGKSAGFKRNLEMLDVGHAVLAFWDGQSRGTRHTIDNALNRGMPVHVFVWGAKGFHP